jgi:hypothetical protein
MRPEDLPAEAASAFRVWRNTFGLSESAALAAVQQDGLVQLPEHDQLARTYREVFDLSEGAARVAANGRRGPSVRPTSEVAGRAVAGPKPGANDRLIRIIEAWAQDLRDGRGSGLCIERGETLELASLRAAYGKALLAARNHAEAAWIIGVVESWRPELLARSGRKGSSGGTSGRAGTVRG